ncbi:MAG: hypothetical protein JJT78_14030 [Leptospira sp.]|nr:hypothetical protein [Leptospira sp.]
MKLAKSIFPIILLVPIFLLADAAPEWGFYGIRKPIAKASSILKESKKSYPASDAIDGSLITAWCEGVKGSGIGETWEVQMSPTPGSGLSVFPGFGGNKRLYFSNNRIKGYEVTITTKNGRTQKFKGAFQDDLCGNYDERECSEYDKDIKKYEACIARLDALCHRNDYNRAGVIHFPKPECVTKVHFKILSVYKGKKHDDTCIAEMDLYRPIDTMPEDRKAFEAVEKSCK